MTIIKGFFTLEQLNTCGINGPSSGECEECRLYQHCKHPRMSYIGKGKKKILIVGSHPSEGVDTSGIPASGEVGELLKKELQKKGIDADEDCWYIDAVSCYPGKDTKGKAKEVTRKEIKCCKPRLMKVIADLKPIHIWLLGDIAITSYWMERESNTSAIRFRKICIPDPERQVWVTATFSPLDILKKEKDNHLKSTFEKDISFLIKCSQFTDPPEIVNVNKCITILKDFDSIKKELLKVIKLQPEKFAFDYETTGKKPYRKEHRITTISFCYDYDKAYSFPYQYRNNMYFTNDQINEICDLWIQILLNPKIKKIMHNCFSGNTQYLTNEGIKTFEETVNTKQQIWTKQGWKEGEIKLFGKAKLTKLVIGPSHRSMSNIKHEILVTENHRWFIDRYKTTQYTTKPNFSFFERKENIITKDLKRKDRIVAELPKFIINEKSDAFRHGLIFADGSYCGESKWNYFHNIRLCGWKEKYKDSFPHYTYPKNANGDPVVQCYKHTTPMKELPISCNADYIANFIEGWQLLDGTDSTAGESRVITTFNKKAAEWLKNNASLGGWYCTGFSEHISSRFSSYPKKSPYWMIIITKDSSLGWTIKEIVPNYSEEKIYCAIVPEIEQFTLNYGIYTSNSKFEDMWTREIFGIDIESKWWCTMNCAHILDNRKEFTGLKFQAMVRWGIPDYDAKIEKFLKSENKNTPFNRIMDAPINDLLLYNGIDSLLTFRLQEEQEEELKKYPKMQQAREFVQEGLVTLCDIQENGINMDKEYYIIQDVTLTERIAEMKNNLYKFPEAIKYEQFKHRPINFGSDYDLRELFFTVLGLSPSKFTPGEKESTDASVLADLDTPIAKEITKIAQLEKIQGTYLGQFLREIDDDERMRPFFDFHIPVTYRGESHDPNFQNIPVRDEEAKQIIRSGIMPSSGNQLIDWDYGAMEVRIIACYTQCPTLMAYIFDPNTDMHRDNAIEIFKFSDDLWDKIPKKPFAKDLRFEAKNGFTFPEFYNSYYKSCARNLFSKCMKMICYEGITVFEHLQAVGVIKTKANAYEEFETHLKKVEERFWFKYKAVKQWQEKSLADYVRLGYIEQMFGFRCQGYLSKNQVVNYPVQGTAFHCLMWSINEINKRMKEEKYISRMNGQVHDCCLTDLFPLEKQKLMKMSNQIATLDIREHFKWLVVPLLIEWEETEIDKPWGSKEETRED